MKRSLLLCLILLVLATSAHAADNLIFFNSSLARPLGMGGAFTAILDPASNHLYNPAAAIHIINSAKIAYCLQVNFARMYKGFSYMFDSGQGGTNPGNLTVPLALGVSQFRVGNKYWEIDINAPEQLLTFSTNSGTTYFNEVSSITGSLRAFPGDMILTIGFTYNQYNLFSNGTQGQGFNAGFHLIYKRVYFGIFYFSSPDLPEVRKPFEHLVHNSYNVGIGYHIAKGLNAGADLKNLGEKMQPHIGIDYKTMIDPHLRLKLRSGGFFNVDDAKYGLGIGGELTFFYDNAGSYLFVKYTYTTTDEPNMYNVNHVFAIGASQFWGPIGKFYK